MGPISSGVSSAHPCNKKRNAIVNSAVTRPVVRKLMCARLYPSARSNSTLLTTGLSRLGMILPSVKFRLMTKPRDLKYLAAGIGPFTLLGLLAFTNGRRCTPRQDKTIETDSTLHSVPVLLPRFIWRPFGRLAGAGSSLGRNPRSARALDL